MPVDLESRVGNLLAQAEQVSEKYFGQEMVPGSEAAPILAEAFSLGLDECIMQGLFEIPAEQSQVWKSAVEHGEDFLVPAFFIQQLSYYEGIKAVNIRKRAESLIDNAKDRYLEWSDSLKDLFRDAFAAGLTPRKLRSYGHVNEKLGKRLQQRRHTKPVSVQALNVLANFKTNWAYREVPQEQFRRYRYHYYRLMKDKPNKKGVQEMKKEVASLVPDFEACTIDARWDKPSQNVYAFLTRYYRAELLRNRYSPEFLDQLIGQTIPEYLKAPISEFKKIVRILYPNALTREQALAISSTLSRKTESTVFQYLKSRSSDEFMTQDAFEFLSSLQGEYLECVNQALVCHTTEDLKQGRVICDPDLGKFGVVTRPFGNNGQGIGIIYHPSEVEDTIDPIKLGMKTANYLNSLNGKLAATGSQFEYRHTRVYEPGHVVFIPGMESFGAVESIDAQDEELKIITVRIPGKARSVKLANIKKIN